MMVVSTLPGHRFLSAHFDPRVTKTCGVVLECSELQQTNPGNIQKALLNRKTRDKS
ncbi:hypothetical protein ZHAS_00004003 [Anopheles sinensis]|uniref:Uncharacterized protein n=1 Tax=Anopheles sinensis TaxID=74873 RepID=A0A084VFU4_ANOSI|nr:hypothetical protein ZHAS_00004003 [Anopheles sinensis]